MKYRKFGKTGLQVSEIGFGTWGIGGNSYGNVDDNESVKALKFAFDKGINFYDTSDLYGNGHSEELLGEVFKSNRDKVIIATKGGNLPHSGFEMPQDFSEKYLKNALERSLKRLKTDYIDIYQLHSPKIDDIERCNCQRTLEKFKEEGRIRYFGVSARSPQDALIYIKKYNFKIIQINFNMIDQRAKEIGLFNKAEELNVCVICRTPLVFGYLTGKLTGKEEFNNGFDHRSNWPKNQLERWANAPKLFEKINEFRNKTIVQLALQFCLSENAISTVIPGMMREKEVEENILSSDLEILEREELNQIYAIYKKYDFYDKNAKIIH